MKLLRQTKNELRKEREHFILAHADPLQKLQHVLYFLLHIHLNLNFLNKAKHIFILFELILCSSLQLLTISV